MALKLWTKLFTRNKETEELALHSAGATVRHRNPFEDVEVPRNTDEMTKDFVDRWVKPYYMAVPPKEDIAEIERFASAAKEIDLETTTKLLGYFDWRPKVTGAYFAAIKDYKGLQDVIGGHLLKSEVCYAGATYCLALACFGTNTAKEYLIKYLEYYLQRKDLWFDQAEAFCALEQIDKQAADGFINRWQEFISDKTNWSLNKSRKHFAESLEAIKKIRQLVGET